MNQIKLCVNTQTPLVRFKLNYEEILEKYGYLYEPINLKDLVENEDYQFTPGGVAEMTYAILKRFMVKGFLSPFLRSGISLLPTTNLTSLLPV